MNLADMLCYSDISELAVIAKTYNCECAGYSKLDLIQSILTVVNRRESLDSRIEELSSGELRLLSSLIFDRRGLFNLEELQARALTDEEPAAVSVVEPAASAVTKRKGRGHKQSAPPAPPPTPLQAARHAIARFKRMGWLFNGYSQPTRFLYQVPDDLKERLREVLERRYRTKLRHTEEPAVYRDERGLLLRDALTVVKFIRDNEVPLTLEGVIHKRQLLQLLERLSVREELPSRGWRFGYGRHIRDYPERLSLLYDSCYYLGYVQESDERLTLTEAGRAFADGISKLADADLYRMWLKLYRGPIPNLSTVSEWIARLCLGWTSKESLFTIVQPLLRPFYYDTSRDLFERRILTMLMHLGVIRIGTTLEGEDVVQSAAYGRQLVSCNQLDYEERILLPK